MEILWVIILASEFNLQPVATMDSCSSCFYDYFSAIKTFHSDNKKSIEFLREHGILPNEVHCPKCNNPCTFTEDKHLWRCYGSISIAKTKKRKRCDFKVSDYKGTFLSQTLIPPWKVILFANHFLSNRWDHVTIMDCLELSTIILQSIGDHFAVKLRRIGFKSKKA